MSSPFYDPEDRTVSGIVNFMSTQPKVEAVRMNPAGDLISLATLGRVDPAQLQQALSKALQRANEAANAEEARDPWQRAKEAGFVRRDMKAGVQLERPSCETAPKFWVWQDVPGLKLPNSSTSNEEEADDGHEHGHDDWKLQGVLAGACGILGLIGWGIELAADERGLAAIVFYFLALVAGGWDAAGDVVAKLRHKEIDIHFLMLAVAVGAASIGAWGEGALLLFLFSFAGALEHYAMDRTRREIGALFSATPQEAVVLDAEGAERSIEVEQVRPGMRIRIRPGSLFPVDARILRGETAADESTLTGEAIPVEKAKGDTVLSGTMNLWGSVDAEVLREAHESALQQIIRLIQESHKLKAPAQRFTDRFGTGYTYLILGTTLALFLFWWKLMGIPAFEHGAHGYGAFYRAMTLLVVASPCALVISIPSAILASIAWGARRGVLFRGGAAVEKLAEVDIVALDKTGTLTTGDLTVASVESYPPGKEQEIIEVAVALERHANHPIARAVVRYGVAHGITDQIPVEQFVSISGFGVKGMVRGREAFLGRREVLPNDAAGKALSELPGPPPGFTEVWVVLADVVGRLLLEDRVREQAKDTLRGMRAAGLRPFMLTGDRSASALAVGMKVGLEENEIRSGLLPEDKVAFIRELSEQGHRVAMIGDGVNDAPSLASAYVAVAMGARGSDAALEESEVILMQDRIERFLSAYRLSRHARRIIRQNIVIALGTVILMVGIALTGLLPLSVGVFAHEGSTVIVVLNSLRLLFGSYTK